jgi:hypothetical protein
MAQQKEAVTMNDALTQWVSKEDQVKIATKIETTLRDNKPTGKCHVCNTNDATAICIKCGSPTCTTCYFTILGLCQQCLSKETVEKWKNKKTDWKTILGVDWID